MKRPLVPDAEVSAKKRARPSANVDASTEDQKESELVASLRAENASLRRTAQEEKSKLETQLEAARDEIKTLRDEKDDLASKLQKLASDQRSQTNILAARRMRLMKWPWMPPMDEPRPAFETRLGALTSKVPDDIWRFMASFLDHDSRFELRVLNSSFYGAYYDDTNTTFESEFQVHSARVLALTEMGRVFPHVCHLTVNEENDFAGLSRDESDDFLLPHNGQLAGLPRLASLQASYAQEVQVLPAFEPRFSITRLVVDEWDLEHATSENFPNLRVLKAPIVRTIMPHPALEEIEMRNTLPNEISQITKEAFPSLMRLTITNQGQEAFMIEEGEQEELQRHFARIRAEGVELEIVPGGNVS